MAEVSTSHTKLGRTPPDDQ